MTMKIFDRFKTVAVMYAIAGLGMALLDFVWPSLGWLELWFDSWALKLTIFVALWILAPFVWGRLDGRQEAKSDAVE